MSIRQKVSRGGDGLSVRKCGARCLFDCVRLGEMAIVPLPFLLLRASGTSFAPRASRSDPAGACLDEPSGSQISRGWTPAFIRRKPSAGTRYSVQQPAGQAVKMGNAQGEPPLPTPDAKGAGVPERKIGSEALEASVKLRRSSIECLSAASFEAARSEQLRLPAEGPLKRRDGSSCKSTLNPLPGLGFTTHGITLFVKEPR